MLISRREKQALKVIEKQESTGRMIVDVTNIPQGTIYKMLYTLVKKEIVRGRAEPRSMGSPLVYYSLTERGQRVLNAVEMIENGETK